MNFVVISPARNEAAFIGQLIECMAAQTLKPLRWVIVSDGSTDGMDDIVRGHLERHPWIQLIRQAGAHDATVRREGARVQRGLPGGTRAAI